MARRSALVNVMVPAAMKAARGLRRDFGEVEHLQVSKKGPADFVSEADRRAEQILFDELSRARPRFDFLMEERGAVDSRGKTEGRWIVDPLDGTTNFLHGLPHWAISIAAEVDGKVTAGVIYDPVKDELFWADLGSGAYVNEQRLRVSGRSSLDAALLATGIPFKGIPDHGPFLTQLETFMSEVAGIRRYGAAALDLAYVAAGRYDGFWECGLHPWDVAAGSLIVSEAGGFVTDFTGRKRVVEGDSIVAGNPDIHRAMLKVLSRISKSAG